MVPLYHVFNGDPYDLSTTNEKKMRHGGLIIAAGRSGIDGSRGPRDSPISFPQFFCSVKTSNKYIIIFETTHLSTARNPGQN